MTSLASPARSTAPTAPDLDNRVGYLGFAAAYVLGHGLAALSHGPEAPLRLPSWVPLVLLVAGVVVGSVASTVVAVRAQTALPADQARPARLLSVTWIAGFAVLALLITAVTRHADDPALPALLWPTGSAFVVGLIYLAEGAMRRDGVHYLLGAVLLLVSGAALLLPVTGALALLAVAGGSAYLSAVALLTGRRSGPRGPLR